MKHIPQMALLLVAVAVLGARSLTQQIAQPAQSDGTKGEVVLTSLSKPAFSPLARQANIEGDVIVDVIVRQDGSTEATVVKGHPLLKQAALDSAIQSRFECRGCSAPLSYTLVYISIALQKAVAAREWERPSKWSKSRNHRTNEADRKLASSFQARGYVFAILLPRSRRKCVR